MVRRSALSLAAERGMKAGAAYGIAAAMLFGLSAPLSKRLLAEVPPLLLAALLYLGAGLGVTAAAPLAPRRMREAPVRRADVGLLAGIVVTGGILGPLLMLYGLQRVSGIAGSLLLNLEGVFTILIAVTVFREHLSRLELAGAILIVSGAAVLGYAPGDLSVQWTGVLLIGAACFSWALDNNWTQRLSLKDPFAVVRIKTLGAGACTLVSALAMGQHLPSPGLTIAAMLLGVFSYGISILLDAYALRHIGAAREAAFFATAPFIGALAALPILGERLRTRDVIALAAMAGGVTVLVKSRHSHAHTHETLLHEHVHSHDEHHQHTHTDADPPGQPHSHIHGHDELRHEHGHVSDVHHRHSH
jgi:drug/metabolite transporter (DMT)-like permease